jgi:hypothetical protein
MTNESITTQLAEALGISGEKQADNVVSIASPAEEELAGKEGEEKGEEAEAVKETSAEDDDDSITYLTDLAETLEVDPGDLYSIKVKTSEGKEYTVGELKDLASKGPDEIERRIQEFEAQKQQAMQVIAREREELLAKTKAEVNIPEELQEFTTELASLDARYGSVDWDKFAEADPGKAAFIGQQYQAARQELLSKIDTAKKNYTETQQRRKEEFFRNAQNEFSRRVPEWSNPEVANKEGEAMTKLVLEYGISVEEIPQITDPRMKHLLRDYAVLKNKQLEAEKTAKTTAAKGAGSLRRSALTGRFMKKDGAQTLVAKAKKSGSKEDVLQAAKALFDQTSEI